MSKIGRPGAKPHEFEAFTHDVANRADALEIGKLKQEAIDEVANSALGSEWRRAVSHSWGQDDALLALLREVSPWRHERLMAATRELKTLAEVVHSFEGLCESLDRAQAWPKTEPIDHKEARNQYMVRSALQRRIQRVRDAIEAAGACTATAHFPRTQLDEISAKLDADVALMEKTRDSVKRKTTPALKPKELDTIEHTAETIAKLFQDPLLQDRITAAVAKVAAPDRHDFHLSIAGFARLSDEALNAPDYALVGRGWFHPNSRRAHRARGHDDWTRWASEARQDASQKALERALLDALASDEPKAAIERSLIEETVREIGIDPNRAKDWKPTAEGIREALKAELFLPLRALNETVDSMNKGDPNLTGPVRDAVAAYTENVLNGQFLKWRYENARGKRQLEGLSKAQLATWKSSEHVEAGLWDGTKLTTREEDGLETAWVTKIGGPSHGFDYNGHCLLPFLSNARTKAILVDDPRWPDNAAARSYLRVLHFPNGIPTLYLEPLQRDFPHQESFGDARENFGFQRAILMHALKKADEMGLTLSIPPYLEGMLKQLGHEVGGDLEHQHYHVYEMRASNGVYEASDTLTHKHDWPQMHDERTEGLDRLLYLPMKRKGG
jgi:hypothetical protein